MDNELYNKVKKHMIDTNMSVRKTAALFNITRTIPEIVSKELNRKKIYKLDVDAFEIIDTEEKAYWLGFLFADGCINDKSNSNMNMEIGLKGNDIDHLYKLQKFLKTDYRVYLKYQQLSYVDKIYESCKFIVYSTKFCNHLIDKGCTPRKSLTLEFPTKIPHELYRHFIRGYVDGDGCISKSEKATTIQFSIVGTRNFLHEIYLYFLETNSNLQEKYSEKGNSFTIGFYGKNAKQLLHMLYKDSTIYLDRKYNKYLEVCSE